LSNKYDQLSRDQLTQLLDELEAELRAYDLRDDEHNKVEYELRQHQIELEIQNRELKESRQELEDARNQYADLYDFAPVGYLSLDRDGCIIELNLTAASMLGRERAYLQNHPFSSLMQSGSSGALFSHLRTVFSSNDSVVDEFAFKQPGTQNLKTFRTESKIHENQSGESLCLMTLSDVTEQVSLLDQIKQRELSYEHLAHHDALTGLPNRLLLADRLNQSIHESHRVGCKFAVLSIDLDHFKEVNDSYDHSFGDEVLKAVAKRLGPLIRENDSFARMGGDEFTIILNHLVHDTTPSVVAKKIIDTLAVPFELNDRKILVGASIGISIYPIHGTTGERLVRNADTAMYKSKGNGRNTFEYYSEEMTTVALKRLSMGSRIYNAVKHKDFVLYYQPQIDLVTEQITGIEALIRWQLEDDSIIGPDQFIPIAEESGIIVQIDNWVLGEACRQAKIWQDVGALREDITMSVNLSGKHFSEGNFLQTIEECLQDSGLSPTCLEIEITETTIMDSPEMSALVLEQLREQGIKVAVDDFGTGYSSLNYLKRLPLTRLKIDQSFVSDVVHDTNDFAIVKAIIAMAKDLSLDIVAEGVETREQHLYLASEGCHKGQGYYFGKPMSSKDFELYLNRLK
jgi:diguanylate cyclase (GGDEF)-like protein